MKYIHDSLDALAAAEAKGKEKAPTMESSGFGMQFSFSLPEMMVPSALFASDNLFPPPSKETLQTSCQNLAPVANGSQQLYSPPEKYEAQGSLLEAGGIVSDFRAPRQSLYPAENELNHLSQAQVQDIDWDCFDRTLAAIDSRYSNCELLGAGSASDTRAAVEEQIHEDEGWDESWKITDQFDFPRAPPSLKTAGSSSASLVSTQDHSRSTSPSPPPVPAFLAEPTIEEEPSYQPVWNFMGTHTAQQEIDNGGNSTLPPVAGPSTIQPRRSSRLTERASKRTGSSSKCTVPEVELNEVAGSSTAYPTVSDLVLDCPVQRKDGRRCDQRLIHNLAQLTDHVRMHRKAGELPTNVKDCALCKDRARKVGKRPRHDGTANTTIQKFGEHIFDIHFGGCEHVCTRCRRSFSKKYTLLRHEKSCSLN